MWTRRSTQVQPFYDETKWRSCGVHVRILADVIAAFGIVLGIIEIVEASIWGPLWNLAGAIILIIICALVIVADRTERSTLYLPYLILTAIGILIYLGFAIALLIFSIILPDSYVQIFTDKGYTDPQQSARIYAFVLMGVIFIVLLIALWCWYIVFKAYKFMRDVIEYQKRSIATRPPTLPRRELSPYSQDPPTHKIQSITEYSQITRNNRITRPSRIDRPGIWIP
uniref:Lysosomal-associated transmembrane protein 4B n=1 Tax=Acrobeloides nanus TaxID=290746 RepID=A0A914D2K0_9BILA